ncbi:MAG: site-2 protease family protein [Bacteroidota bacterium]|nr:site-2 protease family protein [Bacteroidota bacterium]
MKNFTAPLNNPERDDQQLYHEESSSVVPLTSIPPKPELEETKTRVNVWVKSLSSLALYIAVGYFFFNQNWLLVIILTAVVIFHELGHFFAMKLYDYKDLGIFFIPLMGAYVSGTKHEISQKQSAIVLLAGPVPGIIVGVILHWLAGYYDTYLLEKIAWILIYLNILNLLPVYPLDGGQLLNRLFFDDYKIIGKIFIVLSASALAWFAWSISFYPLLVFPAMMLIRMAGDFKFDKLTQNIEKEGINLDTTYEQISDEDYWKIRNAVIKYHPELKDVEPAPPFEYSDKEDKVITTIQGLLQRTLSQDLSIAGKLLILVLWIGCFFMPVLMKIPLRIF